MSSFNILLDSNYRINTASSPSQSLFLLDNLPVSNIQQYKVSLNQVSLNNSVYPINNDRANKIYFQEANSTATTYSATLTSQSYTGLTFASALQTAMNGATGNAYVYTVSYNSATKKLTISEAGNNPFRIVDGSKSVHREMGVNLFDTAFKSSAYTLASPIDISGSKYVDLICNELRNPSYTSQGLVSIIARIPLNTDFGTTIYFEPSSSSEFLLMNELGSNLQFYLRDDRGNNFDLPFNHEVSLLFHFEKIGV